MVCVCSCAENSNRKSVNISMISLTLQSFSVSLLAPGMQNYASNVLFLFVCARNIFDLSNPILSNKYKNGRKIHNSNNCNIKRLPFEMVYHYSKRSPCIVLNCILTRKKHEVICININDIYQTVMVLIAI